MVEYVEKILTPKVRDLTGEELRDAKDKYDPELMKIKSEYMEEVADEQNPADDPVAQAVRIAEVESEVTDDDLDFEDQFEEI
ncbi:MAG: hypothetical protein OXG56_07605 [Gammaproteobacteria bacterium]|nr:hypothetical protein [Gammaproteobacteria bacterium]